MKDDLSLSINTQQSGKRLSEVLRDAGLKSVKVGCDAGDCGACTILIDGAQHCACLTPSAQADGAEIETVETCADDPLMHRLQASFLAYGAAQCGICTPGMLMAAMELLRDVPEPSVAQVEDALGGVLCRCTGYRKIIDAVAGANKPLPVAPVAKAGQAVGARLQRLDGQRKVDGAKYSAPIWCPRARWRCALCGLPISTRRLNWAICLHGRPRIPA